MAKLIVYLFKAIHIQYEQRIFRIGYLQSCLDQLPDPFLVIQTGHRVALGPIPQFLLLAPFLIGITQNTYRLIGIVSLEIDKLP